MPLSIGISAGFKEASKEGAEWERQIVAIGKKYNMRILGPNVLGVITPYINYSSANRSPNVGPIAFIS